MRYRLDISSGAAQAYNRLPEGVRGRIYRCLLALAETPDPPGSALGANLRPFHRVRVGDYRIGYLIDREQTLVRVSAIGHRRTFYDLLARLKDGWSDE